MKSIRYIWRATKSCSSTAMLGLLFVLMCFRSRASFAVTVPDTQPSNNVTQMGRGSFGSALSNPRCYNLSWDCNVSCYFVDSMFFPCFYVNKSHVFSVVGLQCELLFRGY